MFKKQLKEQINISGQNLKKRKQESLWLNEEKAVDRELRLGEVED